MILVGVSKLVGLEVVVCPAAPLLLAPDKRPWTAVRLSIADPRISCTTGGKRGTINVLNLSRHL